MLDDFESHLNDKYGPPGSPGRKKFEAEAELDFWLETLKDIKKNRLKYKTTKKSILPYYLTDKGVIQTLYSDSHTKKFQDKIQDAINSLGEN